MTIKGDTSAAIAFLRNYCPSGPWILSAISAGGRIQTSTFQDLVAAAAWIEARNGVSNLYFQVNQSARALSSKASINDISAVTYLHVDSDPRAGEDLQSERTRIERLFTVDRPHHVPAPTLLIFSGGGIQAFWKLREPLDVEGDSARAQQAAAYNKRLAQLFDGDNCQDISRILRLPGTVNIPDEKKIKRGRVPALATVIDFDSTRAYEISDFEPAHEAITTAETGKTPAVDTAFVTVDAIDDLDKWDVGARIKNIIQLGDDPDHPKKDDNTRSAYVFDVACQLLRKQVPEELIGGILTDARFGISARLLENRRTAKRHALREIANARAKVALDALEFQIDPNSNRPLGNQHNIRVALHKSNVTLRYNTFAQKVEILGLPGFGPHLDDAAVVHLWLSIEEQFKFRPKKDYFYDVLQDIARSDRYHPVQDYLDSLCWDGTPRLDRWLTTYAGAADSDYTEAVGAILLIAAVRRVRQPGCKFDEMVVLESSQGAGKSSALSILAIRDAWFADDLPLNAEPKVLIEHLSGRWIVEAAELKGMRQGQVEHLKALLSRQSDRARAAYGRLPEEHPRQCIIVGTTNSERYLRDVTGNRRFWPVRVEAVDLERLAADRDQLWAEAVVRESAGCSIRLDPSLYQAAANEQEARKIDEPFEGALREALGDLKGKIRSQDAWTILQLPVGQRRQDHDERLGAAMRALGWTRTKLRFGGPNPENCYVNDDQKRARQIIIKRNDDGTLTATYYIADDVPF